MTNKIGIDEQIANVQRALDACEKSGFPPYDLQAILASLRELKRIKDMRGELPEEPECVTKMRRLGDNPVWWTENTTLKYIDTLLTLLAAERVKSELHIVFDGPPSHNAPIFIEVETADGKSINAGKWEQRGEYWHLIIGGDK
jgi:hypothetical protein